MRTDGRMFDITNILKLICFARYLRDLLGFLCVLRLSCLLLGLYLYISIKLVVHLTFKCLCVVCLNLWYQILINSHFYLLCCFIYNDTKYIPNAGCVYLYFIIINKESYMVYQIFDIFDLLCHRQE